LSDLRSFVADGDFDLGIGHDGDADRIVIIDGDGAVIHEDTVLAIIAEYHVAAADVADPVVVTTPNASGRIDERVEAAGGRTERVRLGALHEGIAAVTEPWKHVHPEFGPWIDAVVSAAVFSALAASEGLAALREPVNERPYRKLNIECPDDTKETAIARLESRLPQRFPDATVKTEHGVRLTLPDSAWALVRPSGTEPYLRIYAESDEVDTLIESVADVVRDAIADADERR
jgi:phosphomannomutase